MSKHHLRLSTALQPGKFAKLKPMVVAQHYPRDNMAALWQNIVKFHSDTFPNLLKLAQVAVLLPVHTADVERGFSSQNCILTPKRNRLAINTKNMLMKVKMEGEKERKAEYIRRIVQKWGPKKQKTEEGFSLNSSPDVFCLSFFFK